MGIPVGIPVGIPMDIHVPHSAFWTLDGHLRHIGGIKAPSLIKREHGPEGPLWRNPPQGLMSMVSPVVGVSGVGLMSMVKPAGLFSVLP